MLPKTWRVDQPAAEQIAHLWAISVVDPRVESYLAIARATTLLKLRPQRLYWGTEPQPAIWNSARQEEFRATLAATFQARGLGRYLEIIPSRKGDRLVLYVIRSTRPRQLVTVNDAETARGPRRLREALCDILSYDGTTGRLDVRVSRAWLAETYREALASAAFGDSNFFKSRGAFTLAPLQRDGREALRVPARDSEILRVVLRSCVSMRSSAGSVAYKSEGDLYEFLEAEGLDLTKGELVEARLGFRFDVTGRGGSATVVVRPPNHLSCPDRYHLSVMGFLEDAGLFTRSFEPDFDLWELAGGAHPSGRWALALGCEPHRVDSLDHMTTVSPTKIGSCLEHRVDLLPSQTDTAPVYAVSESGDIELHEAGPRARHELCVEALAKAMSSDLELERCASVAARPGVWDLGSREIGSETFRVYLAYEKPDLPGLELERLLPKRGSETLVVLVPAGRDLGPPSSTLRVVRVECFVPPFRLLRCLVMQLELDHLVPAVAWAPDGRRLVVDPRRRRVWFDGIDFKLSAALFDVFLQIAKDTLNDDPTPIKELKSNRSIPSDNKKTKRDIVKQMKAALREAGRDDDEVANLIRSVRGRGGYQLRIRPWMP